MDILPIVVEGTPEPLEMNPNPDDAVARVKRSALKVPIGKPVELSIGPSALVYRNLPVLSSKTST
jgi:hypothetical protein